MERTAVQIRRARPDEAAALSALILRSKAHWGYSQTQLDGWRDQLTIAAETIARDPVYCAEAEGMLAGVMHLKPLEDGEALLDDLFIEPRFIGAGVGGALWRQAATLARQLGARTMTLYADRHAIPFYQHMGAVLVDPTETASTPLMRCDLAALATPAQSPTA